jgi:tRNA dimethylallyltransferase
VPDSTKIIQVIIGPTASGKSALALEKARANNGVIINCDAMQSYDALHTLTAQPSAAEKAEISHRLYGHLHPARHYSAADWRQDAITEISQAFKAGQTPILCGGTGFYLKALTDGLSHIPDIPQSVRDKAIALHHELGQDAFFAELQRLDPLTASQIDPMNKQRAIRAWEVFEHTGRPLAEWQEEPLEGAPSGWHFDIQPLIPEREMLISNINKRLSTMLENGVLDEVQALTNRIESGEIPPDALIVKAHGYRAFRDYLAREITMDNAIEKTQTETRQYAKRQVTWIRNQLYLPVLS